MKQVLILIKTYDYNNSLFTITLDVIPQCAGLPNNNLERLGFKTLNPLRTEISPSAPLKLTRLPYTAGKLRRQSFN